jgi:hypothetical protein
LNGTMIAVEAGMPRHSAVMRTTPEGG